MNDPQTETASTVVWIANEAGHSYYKVRDLLGDVEVKPLTLGNINPLLPDRLSWDIARGVAKYVRANDVLLISGTPLVNAIAMTLWLQMFGTCRLALWDAKAGEYNLRTIEMENLQRILQSIVEG